MQISDPRNHVSRLGYHRRLRAPPEPDNGLHAGHVRPSHPSGLDPPFPCHGPSMDICRKTQDHATIRRHASKLGAWSRYSTKSCDQVPDRFNGRRRNVKQSDRGTIGDQHPTVILWRKQFAKLGPTSLVEVQKGRGRRLSIDPEEFQGIIQATFHTNAKLATHWSWRTMASCYGVSPATVQRKSEAHGTRPHSKSKLP